MKLTIEEIAKIVGGIVEGDGTQYIKTFAKIEEGKKEALSFLANSKYTSYIYETKSSAVIIDKNFTPEKGKTITANLIRVENPYKSFAQLLAFYQSKQFDKEGVSETAVVQSSAKIGDKVYIGNHCSVGHNVELGKNVKIHNNVSIGDGVTIGENSVIHSGVVVYHNSEIGKNVTVHANTVIGGDGFGFGQDTGQDYFKVPQVGNVIIEDNVEIGSGTTIDRATLGSTVIRKGVKLDNLIQVAHNVEVGENTVIAAQTGIAGSVKIGKNCMFGGQVGIAGHLTIGDGVKIAAQSGIIGHIKSGETIQGTPAMDAKGFNKAYVIFRKLPSLIRRLKSLEKNQSK